MKLLKAHISAFGKIIDQDIDFADGLVTILQPNGYGKTTIANFIKAMLYGLEPSRVLDLDENARKKYSPWTKNSNFGGSLDIEVGDKQYRIERYFNDKDSSFKLYDLQTGKLSTDYTSSIGEEIYRLDGGAFDKILYIPQKSLDINLGENISTKINNLLDFSYDGKQFENAIAILEKERKELKKVGSKGQIYDLKQTLAQIDNDINNVGNMMQDARENKQKLFDLELKITQLNQNLSDIKRDIIAASKQNEDAVRRDRLNDLNNDIINLQTQIDVINAKIGTKEYKDIDKVLTNSTGKMSTTTQKMSKTRTIGVLSAAVICALMIIIGFAFITTNLAVSLAFIIVGFVLAVAVCGYVVYTKLHTSSLGFDYELYLQDVKIEGSVNQRLMVLKSLVDNRASLYASLFDKQQKLKEIKLTTSGEKLDISNLYEQQSMLISKLDELKEQKQALKTVQSYDSLVEKSEALATRRSELIEQIFDKEQRYNVIIKTIELLKKTSENLTTKYLMPIKDNLSKYLGMINDDFYSTFVDADLNVSIIFDGEVKSCKYLSEGYRAIVNFCFRLALVDVLYTKETPFILLDDPFVNLDTKNMYLAKKLLNILAKTKQILYFTCHESRL